MYRERKGKETINQKDGKEGEKNHVFWANSRLSSEYLAKRIVGNRPTKCT